jgi:hypothetical protein
MSTAQAIDAAMRKERLIGRIEAQRDQLAGYGAYLVKPFAAADKAVAAAGYVKQRPWIAGVAAFSLVVLGQGAAGRYGAVGAPPASG